jgi:hypothetical protein
MMTLCLAEGAPLAEGALGLGAAAKAHAAKARDNKQDAEIGTEVDKGAPVKIVLRKRGVRRKLAGAI